MTVTDFIRKPSAQAFAPGGLVYDNQREFRGAEAIQRWIDEELTGADVTMAVQTTEAVHGVDVVTVHVDGAFDKTGLPDPFVLTLYATPAGDKIGTLVIVQNKERHVS